MKKRNLALGVALVALAGCHGGRKGGVFAAGRHGAPDEFAVGRAAPLIVPPDFALVPPRPGAPRPQEADSSQQALNALFGGQQRASAGESALTAAAGPAPAPGIRTDVGGTGNTVVNKGSTTRDILSTPPTSNGQADATTTAAGPGSTAAGGDTPGAANTNPAGTAPQGSVPK